MQKFIQYVKFYFIFSSYFLLIRYDVTVYFVLLIIWNLKSTNDILYEIIFSNRSPFYYKFNILLLIMHVCISLQLE